MALVTIGLGCAFALALTEALVRAALPYNTPETVRDHSLRYVPSIFARHRLAPNQRVSTAEAWGRGSQDHGVERTFVINERGYRGGPIAVPKPRGVIRVVVLGGSSVFDIYATEGRDWPHLVQEKLKQGGHRDIEVINAGVPGHASFDSLGRLYSQIWMFEPDFLLVSHAWNDIKYLRTLDPERPLIMHLSPYDPTADPFQSYRGVLDRLLSSSQIYVKLRNRYFIRKLDPGVEGARRAPVMPATSGDWGMRQFRLDLELLVDASREIGATPVLLTEASLVTAASGAEDRARISYEYVGMDHDALTRAIADCNRLVQEVGRSKNAAVLDLSAVLSGRGDLFADQVHTTARGSEAIATEVAQFLAGAITRDAR